MEKNGGLADFNDTVWCAIYPDIGCPGSPSLEDLQNLHLQVIKFLCPYTTPYIWQHSPFSLSISTSPLPHLRGLLRYGDNVDDEWFLIFLLISLSRALPTISIRVWDTDGEFLLIEAAFHLPRWLNPDTSENRVFIRKGDVFIIPKSVCPGPLRINDALQFLIRKEAACRASEGIQSAIHGRIKDYPEKAEQNMHRVRVRVPVSVALVLRQEPALISLAVDGFYDRDVDAMKVAARMERFLPNGGREEMVIASVRMSRAMYAQLVQQRFQAPKCYSMPGIGEGVDRMKEAELGMKIACGFEMMYGRRKEEGEEGKGSQWRKYLDSLEKSDFFDGLLPGSAEYKRLLKRAEEYYQNSSLFQKTSEMLNAPVKRIDEILAQPFSIDDFRAEDAPPSDDDSWLYNGEDELNLALQKRQEEMDMHKMNRTKDATCPSSSGSFEPDDMVKAMHSFVDKISSFQGAEVPKHREDMRNVTLNADRFLKDMESVMKRKGSEDNSSAEDEPMSDGATDDSEDGYDDEEEDMFMDEYSGALNEQLRDTTLERSFTAKEVASCSKSGDGPRSVDIDFNLVASLLDSFNSQQGQPGPASNLLGLMGLNLPQDNNKGKRN